MNTRVNAGYEIIHSHKGKSYEVVLGKSDKAVQGFVTWESDGKNYWWGHYFSTEVSAMKDYLERVETCKKVYALFESEVK